jgi:hypothetical protein
MPRFRIALLIGCGACAHHAPATIRVAPPRMQGAAMILVNGANAADLRGDGTPGQIFVARRGNNNAHGHTSAAFYLLAREDHDEARPLWRLLPFFDGAHDPGGGREVIGTTEGADCILSDVRVVPHDHGVAEVVIATRELDKSYADSATVTFDYYVLTQNVDQGAGWPPFYFYHTRRWIAPRKYCDVNEAFDRELHLGRLGIGGDQADDPVRGAGGAQDSPRDR